MFWAFLISRHRTSMSCSACKPHRFVMFPLTVSVLLCPLRTFRIKGMSRTFEARLQWDRMIPHRRCLADNLAASQFQIANRKQTSWKFIEDTFRGNMTKGSSHNILGAERCISGSNDLLSIWKSRSLGRGVVGAAGRPFVLHNLGHSEVQDQQIFCVFLVFFVSLQ